MHPYIDVFGRIFPVYGLLLVVGACAAWLFVLLLSKTKGLPKSADVSLAFIAGICGGLVGTVLLRPLMRLAAFAISPPVHTAISFRALFDSLFGEIVFYGGLLGGLAAILIYCRTYKITAMPLLDLFAPALALALAIGRVGCHFAGCCYGIAVAAHHPFAVIYPPFPIGPPSGVPLLAVPLMEAALALSLCIALAVIYLKSQSPGTCAGVYLLVYATWRFIIEFFRGDVIRGAYGPFTTSQYLSIVAFMLGAACLIHMRALHRRKSKENPIR